MKRRILTILALCAISLVLATCGDPVAQVDNRPVIELLSLTVQPIIMVNNAPVDRPGVKPLVADFYKKNSKTDEMEIIKPIIETDWDNNFYNISEGDSRDLWFLLDAHVETARIIATATDGCRIQWGIGNSGQRPARFTGLGEPLTFGDNDFIYIVVSTRDDQFRNYYRFQTRLASEVKLISGFVINGSGTRKAEYINWLDPTDTWNDPNAKTGNISITLAEGRDGCEMVPTFNDDNSTFQYAVANDGETPVFKTDKILKCNDQQLLYVKVIAQNTIDESVYKFRVNVGHIVSIAKLELDTFEVGRLGVPNEGDWEKVVSGSFETADQPAPGFSVKITLEDAEGDYQFGKLEKGKTINDVDFSNPNKIVFDNKDEVAIKILSATKNGSAPATEQYYKLRVDLLPALIKTHPKSTVYYIERNDKLTQYYVDTVPATPYPIKDIDGKAMSAATPLSVELDRSGSYTYQWYTANSWYGGYGFDKTGRIVGEPGFTIDAYHPNTDRGGFDEKNNVSLHNGGNQFYRLITTGDPIPESEGGKGATYTPKIDLSKRPFLAGYSNQSQYYWVEVTDSSGKKVTSKRAVVVTEWGEVWDLGKPTGTKVDKKHYIVDLTKVVPEKEVGIHAPSLNSAPFTKKREKYKIPITFPAGFDIMDYKICTAQAQFFFKDGTPWIQNWTQGDLYFNKDGDQQVGYYNLTNNNAAYGLAGDSKEPQGADLTVTPDEVVTAPAGEKPVDEKPPFEADGVTPVNNGDAQGWFCAYIDLVELRFEGPKRER